MKRNWPALLAHSYAQSAENDFCPPATPLQFLALHVFDFTTYDGAMDELFAQKAVEVCNAITTRTTFEYHGAGVENYRWFLTMVNMPFFVGRMMWGTSIRGAMWESPMRSFSTLGLYEEHVQCLEPFEFATFGDWLAFIEAVVAFGRRR